MCNQPFQKGIANVTFETGMQKEFIFFLNFSSVHPLAFLFSWHVGGKGRSCPQMNLVSFINKSFSDVVIFSMTAWEWVGSSDGQSYGKKKKSLNGKIGYVFGKRWDLSPFYFSREKNLEYCPGIFVICPRLKTNMLRCLDKKNI